MEPIRNLVGKIAALPGDNIDTDRIIPARYLSRISRSGYGELLFHDVRSPDFSLDQPEAKGASILVVGTNFGCGSSREHAVWALQQAGFKAVIAQQGSATPGFSDIFRQNAANCGLLLIELESEDHLVLQSLGSGAEIEIDLPAQTISADRKILRFEIDPATKDALVKGLDLIGSTLQFEPELRAFESSQTNYVPERSA